MGMPKMPSGQGVQPLTQAQRDQMAAQVAQDKAEFESKFKKLGGEGDPYAFEPRFEEGGFADPLSSFVDEMRVAISSQEQHLANDLKFFGDPSTRGKKRAQKPTLKGKGPSIVGSGRTRTASRSTGRSQLVRR